jgi:hypothetical protein
VRRANRGYWVSRQRSSRDLPHTLCVEIAYSTDSSPPREHASPESFTERYKGEGYHAYPRSAVEAAIQVKRAWEALSRESVGLTVSTGGGESLLPETKTEEELKAWAEGRYNGLPERTALAPRTELNEEAKQVVARLDRLADRVRVRAVPDEVQYDDSYFDTWDVCEEEWEELKDDLWRTIEREGVWGEPLSPGAGDNLSVGSGFPRGFSALIWHPICFLCQPCGFPFGSLAGSSIWGSGYERDAKLQRSLDLLRRPSGCPR